MGKEETRETYVKREGTNIIISSSGEPVSITYKMLGANGSYENKLSTDGKGTINLESKALGLDGKTLKEFSLELPPDFNFSVSSDSILVF